MRSAKHPADVPRTRSLNQQPPTTRPAADFLRGQRPSGLTEQQPFAAAPNHGEPLRGRRTGPVKVFVSVKESWQLSGTQAAVLLGYDASEAGSAISILSGLETLKTRDAKDRIGYLTFIHATLDALFRNNSAVREWLRRPQQQLGGTSPLDHMLKGSMQHVLDVVHLVSSMAGL